MKTKNETPAALLNLHPIPHTVERVVRLPRVRICLPVPQSEMKDLLAYASESPEYHGRMEALAVMSIGVGVGFFTRNPEEPFNRRTPSGPSHKTILARSLGLLKAEPHKELVIDLPETLWKSVGTTSERLGISPGELCLTALGYHAALHRQQQRERGPKNPAERFERALKKEHAPGDRRVATTISNDQALMEAAKTEAKGKGRSLSRHLEALIETKLESKTDAESLRDVADYTGVSKSKLARLGLSGQELHRRFGPA